jgi:prepilin-type processing-associated H-X9-DG protein/prepilin-type N-terminal cleavage/methylation domain-containing protein
MILLKHASGSFTLVELLVVIAIISMLVALLTPSLASSKESAKRAKCQSNLHQIGLAITMYSSERGGYLPYAKTLTETPPVGLPAPQFLQDLLRTYLSGPTVGMGTNSPVFTCPSVKMGWVLTTAPRNDYRWNYFFGNGWSQSTPAAGRLADTLPKNTAAMVVMDMAWENWAITEFPHQGVNVLYADGHVGYVTSSTFINTAAPGEQSVASPFYGSGY